MVDDRSAIIVILAMAAATYVVRLSGVWLMNFVPVTPRVEATLRALSTSVLVAIVVPTTLRGDTASWLAVGIALLVAGLTRSTLAATAAGVGAAALLRAVVL